MGEWRCSYTILNLGTRWRLVVSFTSLPLHFRETAPAHIVDEAGWVPEQVWPLWREEHFFSLSGIEPQFLGHPAHSVVAIATELLGS
jgi:hypothetical protein